MLLGSEDQDLNRLVEIYSNEKIDKSKIEELYLEKNKNEWRTKDAIQRYLDSKAAPLSQEGDVKELSSASAQPCEYDEATEKSLCDAYGGLGDYELRWPWIKHIYKINGYDSGKTKDVLEKDRTNIKTNIKTRHDKRNELKDEKDTTHDSTIIAELNARINDLEGEIDKLIRERNFDLTKTSVIPTENLLFDLHWFIKEHALKYVREVLLVLRSQNNRGRDDVVGFVTGKESDILKDIEEEYQIYEKSYGGGTIYLRIDPHQTYSDSLLSMLLNRKEGNRSQKQGKKEKREERG